ncbi:cysteine desulfurase family protein [Solidesulfovibrio magneticus]|uniref:cysteine desulfurase n=1 Tax=Solidesulfovibrio magneticus (strain ATCC 700980 / DSM 13731 / RS-1) TaxID=573370 RepID=C4XM73_SOLM1|nr:cysteine desulfurase family protein [Solidesulfovibrio magneticus]BAH77201.1 cysteine desulfurase [Solidesulfovibrio magneticus RS-1]
MAAVYFDNNATTPLDSKVFAAMEPYLRECWGNPASPHQYGQRARQAVEEARGQVAALLDCPAQRLVFTSGGSEGNNTAILSAVLADPARKRVVTSAVEHHCVLRRLEHLREHGGVEVVIVPVDGQGRLDLDALARAVTPDTALVSLMAANNETGVLWPLGEIAALVKSKGALWHCDAVQMVGKEPLSLRDVPADYLTVSAHKLHGPKGVGALYVGRGAPFTPLIFGGGQESGRRAGTHNVAGIVGFGQAAALAQAFLSVDGHNRLRELRDHLEDGILAVVADAIVHGGQTRRLANTVSLGIAGAPQEVLLAELDDRDFAVSTTSACQSGSAAPSHVLAAMGVPDRYLRSTLRLSLSRMNTLEEIEAFLAVIADVAARARCLGGTVAP